MNKEAQNVWPQNTELLIAIKRTNLHKGANKAGAQRSGAHGCLVLWERNVEVLCSIQFLVVIACDAFEGGIYFCYRWRMYCKA